MEQRLPLSLDDSIVALVDDTGRRVHVAQAHLQPARLWAAALTQDPGATELPTRLAPATLDRVVSFLDWHASVPFSVIEKPLRSCDLKDHGVSAWDLALVQIPDPDLFALMHAANYIDCPPLLDLCGAQVATFIKNQSVDAIRARFHLENDLTPEEEAAIAQETQWAYDL